MFMELCIGNLFSLPRLLTSTFIWTLSDVCVRMCEETIGTLAIRWFLHHDNAPALTAIWVSHYSAFQGWFVVPLPPYSPDQLFPVPENGENLKGKRFDDVEAVKSASQKAPNDIKVEEFKRCFKQWEKRLDKCIASDVDYFEGDWRNFLKLLINNYKIIIIE